MKARILLFAAMAVALVSCGDSKRTDLFNGKDFEGWTKVIDSKDTSGIDPFSVKDGVISITGIPFGYIRTDKVYSDYKAHLEFRWVGGKGTNSGFFQRVQDEDDTWPRGVECQMCHGSVGQFIGLNGAAVEGVYPNEEGFSFKDACLGEEAERPVGEWNELDVICQGHQVRYFVNGVLRNTCEAELTSGHIGIQSEGGPLEVRNVYVEEL